MKRRHRQQRIQPFETLGGRLGIQFMLFLAFVLNLFLAVQYQRGPVEIAIALLGIAIAFLGAWDVYCDDRHAQKLRARIVYETTRANLAENEIARMRERKVTIVESPRWGGPR